MHLYHNGERILTVIRPPGRTTGWSVWAAVSLHTPHGRALGGPGASLHVPLWDSRKPVGAFDAMNRQTGG